MSMSNGGRRGDRLSFVFLVAATACLCLALPAASAEFHLPPPVVDHVGTAQIFTSHLKDPTVTFAAREFVWGDHQRLGGPWSAFRTTYIPFDREPDKTRDIDWYRAHEPDRMSWKCDQNSPATSYKYDFGYLSPLDITSDAVRQDIFDRYVRPAAANGFDGVAFDNVSGTNYDQRCGTFHDSGWVQQFTGKRVDRAYTEAVRSWLKWMRDNAHVIGIATAANIVFDPSDPTAYDIVAHEVDVVVDETGFSRKCSPSPIGKEWEAHFLALRRVAIQRGLVIIDQACEKFVDIPENLVEWSLANYHLLRGERTYLALVGLQEYGVFLDRPELSVRLGAPTRDPQRIGAAWMRRYEQGGVIVNPSADPLNFVLPPGAWNSLGGELLPPTIHVDGQHAAIWVRGN